jgi:serine/threonine protein phosphatase PrpC
VQETRSGTKPFETDRQFQRRPAGAIFNDIYLLQSLTFSDDQQKHYQVVLLDVPQDMQLRVCPNPECGAIFPPRNTAPEIYCTDCGMVLENGGKDLTLVESRDLIPDQIVRVAAKGLSHGSVRAPLSTFVERLGGETRHCLVLPQTQPLESSVTGFASVEQALKWGATLARGLDYLHDNGITMNGQVDNTCLGLVGDRIVWANFACCSHHMGGYVQDREPDTRALATLIYQWTTGRSQFEPDARIPDAVNHAFEQALIGGKAKTGKELAKFFESALSELSTKPAVYLLSGRYTHVGMVRNLNEDSVLTVEMNRIQQSVNRPLGVYVVADGLGGSAAGEVASSLIVDTIAKLAMEELMPPDIQAQLPNLSAWLVKAVETANTQVFNLRKKAGTDMGSTLVAAVIYENKAYITHIGDSRAYLVNASGIQRLTIDHSLVERLIASNQISREEARYHPQRNVIYRAVGDKAKLDVEVDLHTLKAGDRLLLCSDGLSGMIQDETIQQIVVSAESPQKACQSLIEAGNAAGGGDNISAIIVQFIEP